MDKKTTIEMVWPGVGYDPETCVTADELRACGLKLPTDASPKEIRQAIEEWNSKRTKPA